MLVAIEGNNGAGKTTIIRRLAASLKSENVIVSEYNSTSFLKEIQYSLRDAGELKDPILYEYLQLADIFFRVNNLKSAIRNKRKVVIMDRYIETLLVRDGVRGIDRKQSEALCNMLPLPDLTFFLDVSAEDGLKRVLKRGKITNCMWCVALRDDLDGESFDSNEYMKNLDKMSEVYRSYHAERRYIIDSNQSIEDKAKHILEMILEYISEEKHESFTCGI